MSGIVIKGFAGMRPIMDPKLLGGNEAQKATNTRLFSGAIDSYHESVPLIPKKLPYTIQTLFRARRHDDETQNWFEFSVDVDAIRSPVYQDDYGRVYWTGEEYPKYAPETLAFSAGDGAYPRGHYKLGIPAPDNENQRPVVEGSPVPEPDEQTREYLVTYCNQDGSIESGPCDLVTAKVLASGLDQGYYEVDTIEILNSTSANIKFKQILDMNKDNQVVLYGFASNAWNIAFEIIQVANEKTLTVKLPSALTAPTITSSCYGRRRTMPTVKLTGLPNVAYTDSRIKKMRIYRRVNGTYRRLATIDIGDSEYEDSRVDADCSSLPAMSAALETRPRTPIISPTANIPYTDTSTKPTTNTENGVTTTTTPTLVSRIYAISYVSKDNAEGVLSGSSGVVYVADGATAVTITHAETPPEGAVMKRLYRQDATQSNTGYMSMSEANYRLVAELPASQETYSDNLAQSAISGRAAPTVIDGLPPPSYTPAASGNLTPKVIPETRVYVYTFVSEYGEEGPPSMPSLSSSIDPTEPVTVTNLAAVPTGAYNITKKYIYRTSSGTGATNYQFVAEIPAHDTSFVDRLKQVELGEPIPSTMWEAPPADMKGLRMMANGICVGYSGKDLLFSPPFMPHAYPSDWRLTLEDTIVGIGVYGQSCVALTNTYPYIANGVDPESMTLTKTSIMQACVSKRSIAETGDSIIYASPDGLCMIGQGGFQVVTKSIFTPQQWLAKNPSSIHAFMSENRYHAFYELEDGTKGMMLFDFTGQSAQYVEVDFHTYAAAYVPELDSLIVAKGNGLEKFDKGDKLTYTWSSKVFEAPQPTNYAFAQVIATGYGSGITFKIYADDSLRHTQTVTSQEPFRLPSGFKARNWYVEVSGNTPVQTIVVAKTANELKQV